MKINFDTVLLGLDGEPIKSPKPDGGLESATLCAVARNALLARYQDEQNLSGQEQYHRYELAKNAKGETEWVSDDVTLLKRLIAKLYGPLVIGPAFDLIEPK